MRKIVIAMLLVTVAILAVFVMASCDNEDTKTDNDSNNDIITPPENDPTTNVTVHTVSSEIWHDAFEANNFTYTVEGGNPVSTVKLKNSEVAVYYPDNSCQYFSKLLDGRVIVKYFSKAGDSSLTYTPGSTNYYTGLSAYDTARDFVLVNFIGFYDRFTYDEAKETYVFDGTEDGKTLHSNIILQNAGCDYSHVEVSFDNGNITKIYALPSTGGDAITINITAHGNTTIDID